MGLTKKQINDVREHLENAQNPLFLFDNDQDGLCSFLILQRFIHRGKGFPVKNSRTSGKDYLRKINEFDSDYVFILDVPEFSEEFYEELRKINIPVVWIDHHDVPKDLIPDFVNYYNPFFNKTSSDEPVTYLCYQISKRKEDMWLGVVGCVSDHFIPDFYEDFKKEYPELCLNSEGNIKPFDIFYNSEIGKIARIFGFAIKDKTTNVINMMKFLMNVKSPHEVLDESKENKIMHRRFFEIDRKWKSIVDKAKSQVSDSDRFVFFSYAGDVSMSSEIANYLRYIFYKKYVFVAYTKGARVNISARGENVKDIVLNAISKLENATGGGHENAVGAQIDKNDLDKFKILIGDFFD